MKTTLLPDPPEAAPEPSSRTVHGQQRTDEYAWMRLRKEQLKAERPDAHTRRVIDHLRAENAYTDAWLAPHARSRRVLEQEMRARIKEDDNTVPFRSNGYWYRVRYAEGAQYPVHQRAAVLRDPEQVPEHFTDLLDERVLARGHEHFDLADYEVSPGNVWMAYFVDTVGLGMYRIRFRNLHDGRELDEQIANAAEGGAFADDHTFFYVRKDQALRDARVFRHILGTDPASDVEVFHEEDEAFSCEVYRSRSDRYVVIDCESTLSSEYHLLDALDPLGEFDIRFPREPAHEFDFAHMPAADGSPGPGTFYILTNWQARNFRLMSCPEDRTAKEHWTEVLPHREDVLLEDVDLYRDHLVLTERHEGLVRLRVIRISTGQGHLIEFPDPVHVIFDHINPEWDTTRFRYGYTSLTTPLSVYEHDLLTGSDRLLKQQPVLGGFSPSDYVSERLWAVAEDGVRVPISVVRHRDVPIDGNAPLLLAGYGAYGINSEPAFSGTRLSLLDRGFVYAIAHVRGGSELGRAWYEAGRTDRKMNSFTDFIACGEALIRTGHADAKRLYCIGGSAGGLLVGGAMQMRPDLWAGVVAEVPFVDVVNTMLDPSLPLTAGEYDEWGDPHDPDTYRYLMRYSPYDNVRIAHYPALLATAGLYDGQVQFWEPAKWVARLRAHQQGPGPLLLWTNLRAGHQGATGRFDRLGEIALVYTFLLARAFPNADP